MERLFSLFKEQFRTWSFLGLILFIPNSFAAEGDYLYINLQGGASLPLKLKFTPGAPWDPSPDGYNKRLRGSEVLGVGLGYHFCPLLSTEINLDHRNSFKYKKNQSSPSALGNKIRYFNIKNTTVMANFILHGRGISDCLVYENNNYFIEPFVNAGLGVAYNTVENFHSLQLATGNVFSMMSPYTKTNLAYQIGLGFQVTFCERLSVGFGYRHLGTGRFRSNNYLIDNSDNPLVTSGVASNTWSGRFKTNELYFRLVFAIN